MRLGRSELATNSGLNPSFSGIKPIVSRRLSSSSITNIVWMLRGYSQL